MALYKIKHFGAMTQRTCKRDFLYVHHLHTELRKESLLGNNNYIYMKEKQIKREKHPNLQTYFHVVTQKNKNRKLHLRIKIQAGLGQRSLHYDL